MARWILLCLTILGLVVVFTTRSPALLGVGLLLGIGGFIGFVFALAADRISAASRPETSIASVDELSALRRQVDAKKSAAPQQQAPRMPRDPAA